MNIILAMEGRSPDMHITGTNLRWVSENEFYYLSGSRGDWEIRKGEIDGRSIPIVRPGGDFIDFDFVP